MITRRTIAAARCGRDGCSAHLSSQYERITRASREHYLIEITDNERIGSIFREPHPPYVRVRVYARAYVYIGNLYSRSSRNSKK